MIALLILNGLRDKTITGDIPVRWCAMWLQAVAAADLH